ncbi:MAG: hypothetical protein LLF92_05285 [Planctomycetaceae bacterium]|nr:hypothetical protein [Planctomycetaceae bacterium]
MTEEVKTKYAVLIIGAIGFTLLLIIAAIDIIGVRIINRNGLVFDIHCYSMGITFWLASSIFIITLYKLKLFKKKSINILLGFSLGGFWWLMAFIFLMMGFHSIIGGSY